MAKQLIPKINTKSRWIECGLGISIGLSGWVIYNNFFSPTAQASAAMVEPTYALRRFGGYGNERNVFGSVFSPTVGGFTHATHPGARQMIKSKFRGAVLRGVHAHAMDKNTVAHNTDRIQRVIGSQEQRLDELLKSKPVGVDELLAEIN